MSLRRLVPFLVAALVIVCTTPLRYVSLHLDLWVSFLLHFGIFLLLLLKLPLKPTRILLSYLAAPLLLYSFDFLLLGEPLEERFRHTMWTNILPVFFAPVFAYWIHRSKTSTRILIGCLALFVYFANIFWLTEKWRNFQNIGVLSNDVSEKLPAGWIATSVNGNQLSIDSLNGKLVLIDFWNSGCAACIRSFPKLDSVFRATKSDPLVRIQSIFIPYGKNDTPGHAEMIVAKKNAGFPVVTGIGLDSVFGIKAYPTVLLVYQNRIIHRGTLETAISKMNDILKEHPISAL